MEQADNHSDWIDLFGPEGQTRLINLHLVEHRTIPKLAIAALRGELDACRLVNSINHLLDRALARELGCLHCDALILPHREVVFCVLLPEDMGEVTGGGILCPNCALPANRGANAVAGIRNLPMVRAVDYADVHAAGHA